MNKEKLLRLMKYLEHVKEKMSVVSEKHKNHPKTYQAFWEKELKMTTRKIDDLRLQDK